MSLANPARAVAGVYATAADARADIVAALQAVGINAAPVAPDSPTPGAAWPQWTQTEFNGHMCDPSRYSFAVFFVLNAGNLEAAVSEADALVAVAVPALYPLAFVQAAEPVQITFAEGTTMPGIRVRVVTRA